MKDMYLFEQDFILHKNAEKIFTVNFEHPDHAKQMAELDKHDVISIDWAKQEDFERSIELLKNHVKILVLFSPKVVDLTPLESLSGIEYLVVNWNQKTTRLWDVSKNSALKELALTSFRKVTDISDLRSAVQLKGLYLGGDLEQKWRIADLEPLSSLVNLDVLGLWEVRLEKETFTSLHSLKQLKHINAGTKICSTEEYARLFAALEQTCCEFSSGILPMPDLGEIALIGKGKRSVNNPDKAESFSLAFQESVIEYRRQMLDV